MLVALPGVAFGMDGASVSDRGNAAGGTTPALAPVVALAQNDPPQAADAGTGRPSRQAGDASDKVQLLDTVIVTGQRATDARSGIFGMLNVLETPFSISVVDTDPALSGGAVQYSELVSRDSSVQIGEAGNEFTAVTIRGLGVSNSSDFGLLIDGSTGLAEPGQPVIEFFDRIEIMKGLSQVLGGFRPVAGAINLISKRATTQPLTQVTASYLSDAQFGGRLDWGRRYGERGEFGVRVNLLARDGDGYQDHNETRTLGGAVALDYRGERWRLSLDAQTADKQIDGFEYFVTGSTAVGISDAPDGSNNLHQKFTTWTTEHWMAAARAEFDLSEAWSFRAGAGLMRAETDYNYTAGNILNTAGDTELFWTRQIGEPEQETLELGTTVRFATGRLSHRLSMDFNHLTSTNTYVFHSSIGPLQSNIYAPVYYPEPLTRPEANFIFAYDDTVRSIGIADIIGGEGFPLEIVIGGRWQEIEQGNTFGGYEESRFTPAGGLLWKFNERFSIYANYTEGLEPGGTVGAPAANQGEQLPFYVSKQYEAGLKFRSERIQIDAAVFQLGKPTGYLNRITNIFADVGERRFRGVEASLGATLSPRFRFDVGFTALDPELTDTGDLDGDGVIGDVNGKTAAGVSTFRGVMGGEYDLFVGSAAVLTATGRLTHENSVWFDPFNTTKIDGRTLLDLGLRLNLRGTDSSGWVAALNVTNVTNEKYCAVFDEYALLATGAPRVVRLCAFAALLRRHRRPACRRRLVGAGMLSLRFGIGASATRSLRVRGRKCLSRYVASPRPCVTVDA